MIWDTLKSVYCSTPWSKHEMNLTYYKQLYTMFMLVGVLMYMNASSSNQAGLSSVLFY